MSKKQTPRRQRLLRFVSQLENGCWIWIGAQRNGYGCLRTGTREEGVEYAHRAAWTIFRGPIPEGMYVCHKCDVRLCVNPDHLFLGTQQDNLNDAMTKGRTARGERNGQAKLTERSVIEIIRLCRDEGIGKSDLARRYGVSPKMIELIVSRKKWSHVKVC